VGYLIISHRNDPTIAILDTTNDEPGAEPVRNGNCWCAAAAAAVIVKQLSSGRAEPHF
jgi:hypothetical protein